MKNKTKLTKICCDCSEQKALHEFCKHKGGTLGLNSRCRKCSNAHIKKWRKENKDYIEAKDKKARQEWRRFSNLYKSKKGCLVCEERHPTALVFHHRAQGDREFNVGSAYTVAKKRLIKELEKCEVLCANCHTVYHIIASRLKFNNTAEEIVKIVNDNKKAEIRSLWIMRNEKNVLFEREKNEKVRKTLHHPNPGGLVAHRLLDLQRVL